MAELRAQGIAATPTTPDARVKGQISYANRLGVPRIVEAISNEEARLREAW